VIRQAAVKWRHHHVFYRTALALSLMVVTQNAWASTSVPPPAATASATSQANAQVSFDLNEIRVEGATLLSAETIEQIVYPFLGPGKTKADVIAARDALAAAYHAAGYATVAVAIPPQHVGPDGVIKLNVNEIKIRRLKIVGARYFLPSDVRAGAPSLAPGVVPNMKKVTHDITALNQLPDRTVEPQLRPSLSGDAVDAELDVQDKFPLHGSVELNNRYNADTHALRLNASLNYGNLFQRGDTATLSYQVAPEDVADAEVTSASYLFHVPGSTLSLLMSYLHSNSNVTTLGTTNVAGRGTQAGFRLLVPLGSEAGFSQSLSVGWDYKKYYEIDTTSGQFTSAPITYYPLNATYAGSWQSKHSTTDLTAGVVLGLDQISSNDQIFYNKRYNAAGNFAVLKAGLTETYDFSNGMEYWSNLQTQESADPLVSSEQFGLGGGDSVRGYLESEALGDWGGYVQNELRSKSYAKYVRGPVTNLRVHIFLDAGYAGTRDPLPSQRSASGLSSAGAGVRVSLWDHLNGELQDAQTFNQGPVLPIAAGSPGTNPPGTRAGTNRVLFRLYGEF
jgi:hemolysin activation/secretion protein